MESDEISGKPLQYYWNQYITTVNRKEKAKYLDGFLVEFLKTYFWAGGQLSKVPSFGDLHSVSNMLAREFQTLILAQCSSEEGDQEQLLVGFLCNGPGLMLLEVLCILAYKIAGCSNELANLVVTLLRVLFRVPPHGHDFFQAFQMTKLDYENYFQDSKCKPHHSSKVHELILKHCSHVAKTRTFTFDCKNIVESTPNPSIHDQTDSSSVTESSDMLTSISSMGSAAMYSSTDETVELHRQSSGFSSLLDNTEVSTALTSFEKTPSEEWSPNYDVSTNDLTPTGQQTDIGKLLSEGTLTSEWTLTCEKSPLTNEHTPIIEETPSHEGAHTSKRTPTSQEYSTGQTSASDKWCATTPTSEETPTIKERSSGEEPTSEIVMNDDTPTPRAVLQSSQDISIDTFELLLLMLTVLENLCCREASSYDTTLTIKTSGQLIDLIDNMHDKKDGDGDGDHEDLEVLWDIVASIIARLSILRTVLFFLFATFRNPKSAKQLVRNNYVSKLVGFVDHELPSALLTSEQLSELVNSVSSERSSSLWKTFSHIVYISLAFRGLLTFQTSCLQFGSLINSSLLALSRELLEQFSLADGFDYLATIALKCEEMHLPGSHSDSKMTSLAIAVKMLPRDTTLHVLNMAGKIISLLKKSKLNCKAEADVVPRRKSVDSYLQFQPPSELMTSDVDESSESAGDMESENDKQSRNLVDKCQILPAVTSLLNVFKESRTQALSSSILSCLANVGVCSCLQPVDLISPLLTRFLFQPRPLQTQILKLINQLIITSLDDTILPKEPPAIYSTRPRSKSKRLYSKSPKSSPSRRSMGLSDSELLSRSPHQSARSPPESDTWSCFSQYCSFLTSGDHWLSLETAKSLRTLVQLGSTCLKNELFRVVLLPSIFRFDLRRKQDVDSMSANNAANIPTDFPCASAPTDIHDISCPSETCSVGGTPTNVFDASTPTEDYPPPSPSSLATTRDRSQTLRTSTASLNKDVLQVLLGYLPNLLVSQTSRLLFFSCGGLSELQSFLDVDGLQELVIGVLEFLASLEDSSKIESTKDKESDALESESSEDSASAVKTFLNLLQNTADVEISTASKVAFPATSTESKNEYSAKFTNFDNNEAMNSVQSDNGNVRTLDNPSLRFHVWKACLNLLVSNRVFVDAFAADDGAKYSYELFKWLIGYFKSNVNAGSQDVYVVALFEVVLAVCIRIAYTGLTQGNADFPDVNSIVHEAELTVLHSSIIRDSLDYGLCDSFIKAAVKKLYSSSFPSQQDNSEVLESIITPMIPEGEWSQLMFDDDFDSPAVQKKSIEDGYEADNEVNTDSSGDDSDRNVVKQTIPAKRSSRGSRKSTEITTVDFHGLVIYPQICQFLFKLLEAAYSQDNCRTNSKSLSVLTHAAQSLLRLVKDCEQNCRILCDEGLLGSVLQCYKNILSSEQSHFRGLQTIVIDIFISLAGQTFKARELKDFIGIFKSPSIPIVNRTIPTNYATKEESAKHLGSGSIPRHHADRPFRDLLCSGLATVASKACLTQGPAFIISFPCRIHTVDPRLKHTTRKGKSQRLRQDSLIKRGKPGSLIQSTGESEGASTEGSFTKVSRHSPDCPERYRRQSKPHSKSSRGSKARTDTDSNKSNEILQSEDSVELPSPFSVKAVNLRCLGNQPWPLSELSIALWVRVHNQKRFPDTDVSLSRDANPSSRSNVEWPGLRSDSMSSEDSIHVCSFGSRKCLFEIWLFPSNTSFLFRWTKFTKGGTDGYDILKEVVTRAPSLTRGRWHHVVVSLSQSKQRHFPVDNERIADACKILLVVDGTDVTEHNFGPPLPQSEEKSTLSVALIGHVILTSSKREKTDEEKVVLPDGYDIGSVMLFAAPPSKGPKKHSFDWLIGKNEAFYLYSLGPNTACVGHLQNELELINSNNSSQPFLFASKLWSRLSITERSVGSGLRTGLLTSPHIIIPELETSLRGLLFLSYSPTNPSMFSQVIRSPIIDEKSRRTSQYDVTNKQPITNLVQNEAKLFHEVKSVRVSTLLEAAYDVGGMTVFIYLFAKVVEVTNNPKTQADALSVVLSLQRNCEYHARAMDQQSGYALLKRILLSPQCMVGYHMLKVLMEAACDGDVFKHTNLSDNPIMLNIDSNAVVRNVDIFQHYLLNWKIWDKAKQGVFEMLLSTLEILVHASHPHYKFNISQFQKAELVQQLLIGCQERQGEGLAEMPSSISTLYVNIIQSIMGSPPDLTVLKAVCEFLIAIHPTEETTRLHSPNRFYLSEHTFDFGYQVPSVTRKPLSRTSLPKPVQCIKKHSPIPPSPSPATCSASNHGNGNNGNGSFGSSTCGNDSLCNYGDIPRRESSSTLVLNRDEQERKILNDGAGVMSHTVDHGISNELFLDPRVEVLAPHYASCPQPRTEKKLAVQIPYRPSSSVKPICGSADGASILLQNSPVREQKISLSSPTNSQTPPTPQSYKGPDSKPMSISQQSTTPKSVGMTSSVDVMEYDFINESDFSSVRSSLAHQSSVDEYLVVEGYPGIKSSTGTYKHVSDRRKHVNDHMTKMRLGLLKLLQKVLLNLQAEQVPAVIGGVLKVEYLLVWVSHQSVAVRELVIKILCLYLQKAEAERYNHFVDIRGFHLLANQIYDHQVNKGTIEALLWLLVGRPVDLDKDYAYSTNIDQLLISTVRSLGVVPLLSIIEDTMVSQHLHHMLVKHLCQLFLKVDELSLKAVAHGLLYTICNVICGLANLQYQQNNSEDEVTVDVNALMDDLQTLIASVVIRACSTCGALYFQMFEDLLVVLENLEERDHRRREYGLSIFFIARYLRYFAIQVALHFFHEICKDEIPANGRKQRKSSGIRFPFGSGSKTADTNPFSPVSSWIPLSHDHNMPCSNLGFLKNTPTSANFNEQTQRFQSVLQTAVNCVVYSRTLLSNDLSPLQFYAADLQVHECLRPAMIKGAASGVNIEKEFAQFVFSVLFESLEKIMDGTLPSKILFVSKDIIKSQLGKVLVYLLSPSLSVDLSCFAAQVASHPQAKKFLQNLLNGSGGGKIREKLVVYLPMLLSDAKINDTQLAKMTDLKSLLESCGLKFPSYDDSTSKNYMEVQVWDQTDTTNIMEWQKKRVDAFRVISQRIEALNGQMSKSAMDVTRVAVEIQDSQRQTLLKHNRDALSAEVQVRKKWRQLIERLIHERSIWYDRDYFPKSWRLDPTEGPLRVRCRMQRFHLDVPSKYVMEEHRKNSKEKCSSPLAYLFEDSTSSHHKNVYYIFDTQDTIRFLYHCRHILLDVKTKGVILIGESHMYFIGEEATTADTDVTQILLGNKDAISISWLIKEIQEIRTRRYCLQDIGVEVFLTNGRTYLLAFETENDRDIVLDQFKQRLLPIYETPATENIHSATMQWRSGNLSNFEYLTELNKMAGRTFNDLMQYPVFPFILSDFTSEVLDLKDLGVYRDLSKPIAAQNHGKEMNYRERFRWLKEEYDRSGQDDPLLAPYHYGSHYSNSGTVLHFLVRVPPFTKMFLQYQDRSFDIPDRTFHSLATTWRLSSYESSTDVKELIPEFFVLPEFLENFEGFDFGYRQCGDRVMDVTLPPWAKGNTRLFILIHRQALETEHVSRHINKWIDLVFGYKQTGPEAVESINVFHPATYYGVQVSSITDPIRQNALKTMIETYGQTPRQLFTFPHSPRLIHKNTLQDSVTSLTNAVKYDVETTSSTSTFINRFHQSFSSDITVTGTADTFPDAPKPVSTVEGLNWGHYVCSPSLPVPSITLNHPINVPGTSLVCDRFDRVHVLCKNTTLLSVSDDRNDRALLTAVLSWSTIDGSIMVFPEGVGVGAWLMDVKTPDKVTSCAVTNECTSLFIGSSSGALSYLPISYNPTLECKIEFQGSRVRLYGHSQAVTSIKICHEYSILVSGSHDSTAIIWDLFRLSYIRTLEHETAVQMIAVSCRSGDVATVSHQDSVIDDDSGSQGDQGSTLHLWSVNGRPVASARCDHVINCVDFSRAPEGVSVNVIATGLSNGAIRLWSTWDLQHIRDIAPEQNIYPIISVAFSDDSQRLFALNTQSRLIMWQRRDKINTRPPLIITFPSSSCGPKIPQDVRAKTDS